MTEKEFLEKFDDRHQVHFYCIGLLDGDGEDDRRVARLIAHLTAAILNSVKLQGKPVDDSLYRSEDEYMPGHWKQDRGPRLQSWEDIKGNLGF